MRRRWFLIPVLAIGIAAMAWSAAWPFSIVQLSTTSPNFRAHDWCAGITPGGTDLAMGGTVGYWPPRTEPDVIETLTWQFGGSTIYGGTTRPNKPRADADKWKFEWGSELNGTLTVDRYKAFDDPGCLHGAQFGCHYTKGTGDPDNLDWIQIAENSEPWQGLDPGKPHGDPYPSDGPKDGGGNVVPEDRPFYYYTGENRNWLWSEWGQAAPGGVIFSDQAQTPHNEANRWSGWFRGNLYLAAKDAADAHKVKVYAGIRWGWDGACVPEPTMLTALLTALVAVLALAGRRRARA